MTQHEGRVSFTLQKSGLFVPHIQDAFAELILNRPLDRWDEGKRRVTGLIIDVLAPVASLVGIGLHDRQKAELFEHLLKGRYFAAGAADIGDYLEQEIMEFVFNGTAMFSALTNIDVHLYTSATGDGNSTGTEVTGGSYAAEAVPISGGWDAASGGATANTNDTDFGQASANWGTVSHASLEAGSTANRLFHGALSSSKTVNNGDTFKFPAGDIDVSIA